MRWTIVQVVVLGAALDIVTTISISGFKTAWEELAHLGGSSTIGGGIMVD